MVSVWVQHTIESVFAMILFSVVVGLVQSLAPPTDFLGLVLYSVTSLAFILALIFYQVEHMIENLTDVEVADVDTGDVSSSDSDDGSETKSWDQMEYEPTKMSSPDE